MTVAHWNESDYINNLQKLFKEKKDPSRGNNYIEVHRSSYKSCAPFTMAARLVRHYSQQYKAYKTLLVNALGSCGLNYSIEDVIKGMPLIVPSKNDPTKLRVFMNIPIDRPEDDRIENVCWVLCEDTLLTLYKNYKEDQGNLFKSKGWDNPTKVWTKIKKFEEMPIQRVITRFTNLAKLGASEKTILMVGTDILEQRKPMELIFVTSPDGAFDMYGSGPSSCMDHRQAGRPAAWALMAQKGVHPTSFFYYHPYIQGVYAKQKGAVVARTYLYEKKDGKRYYGRVYSASAKHGQVFEQNLKDQGFHKIGTDKAEDGMYRRECSFTIPGVPNAPGHSTYYMPLPYCDNLADAIHVTYDKETKVFSVKCGGSAKANVQNQSAQGYVISDNLESRVCARCQHILAPNGRAVIARDNTIFCGSDCARASEYVHAQRDDGERVWIPRNTPEIIQDCREPNRWYTNRAAALRRGLLPVMFTLGEEPEEELLSMHGGVIKIGEDYYRNGNDKEFDKAVKAGILKQSSAHYALTGDVMFEAKSIEQLLTINLKHQKVVEFDDSVPFIEEVAA